MKTTVRILYIQKVSDGQLKNIHYCIQNYPATLLVGRMVSPNKDRKYNIC